MNKNVKITQPFIETGHFLNLMIFLVSLMICGLSLLVGSTMFFIVPILGIITIVVSFVKKSYITFPFAIVEIISPFLVIYAAYFLNSLS